MTKEEFEYLSQFDDRFNTATKANYARAVQSKDVEKIRDIYSRLIGQPYKMNTNCSTCVLKLLQKLSKYYFEHGEKNSRETQESETEHNDVGQGNQEEGNSKKAGKRKK